jgi:site-specific DNA recombinase
LACRPSVDRLLKGRPRPCIVRVIRYGHGYRRPVGPLVDRRRFYIVQKFLTAPDRRTNGGSRPGRAVHVFSMILKCGVCGGPLAVRGGRKPGAWDYNCDINKCVRADKGELDSFATDAILAALRSPQLYQALMPTTAEHDTELATVRDKLAEIRAQHDELARMWRRVRCRRCSR